MEDSTYDNNSYLNTVSAKRSKTEYKINSELYSELNRKNISIDFNEKMKKKYGETVKIKIHEYEQGNYEGQMDEHGKMNGEGIFIYSNGDFYEGQFVKGLREGEGEYTWADGSTYVGTWKDDTKNGWGLYKTDNKECYCEWEMDKYLSYLPIKSKDVSLEVNLDFSKLACSDSIDFTSNLLNDKSKDTFKSIFKCIHKYGSSKKKVSFILHSREQSLNFGEEISKNLMSVFEEVEKEENCNIDIEFLGNTGEDENKVFFTSCRPSPNQSGNNSVEYHDSTTSTPTASRKQSTKN
jgi:hypothetical protein